jgi:DnaK suppressor protein
MDPERARELLRADRARTQRSLDDVRQSTSLDRTAANDQGDMYDSAEPLYQEGVDDATAAAIERHLEAIDRAEARLDAGTYGRSVRSGEPIPDVRLEADPTAELTVDEAAALPPGSDVG